MKTAKRVYLGSYEPEYYLFVDGVYVGYHSCYHSGPLPADYRLEPVIAGEAVSHP